jgi:hypothetical protein
MTKTEAIREARIGALYQGGDWYVIRWKRGCYKVLPRDRYRGSIDGRIVKTLTPASVRRTAPPTVSYRLHFFAATRHEGCGHKHKTWRAALTCAARHNKHRTRTDGKLHVYRAWFDARGKFHSYRDMTDAEETRQYSAATLREAEERKRIGNTPNQ